SLFKLLSIKSTISIASELTSGEKSSAAKAKLEDTKQKQIALLVSNSTSLKSACEICKGQCKTFMFICSTIRPELLKDILGMSDGCPLALWAAINNCYGNNDVALQAAQCNLRRPDIYLICPGNSIHSVWAHIQALISVLATETGRHKMLEQSRLVILVTVLKSIDPAFEAQFNTLADDSTVEVAPHAATLVAMTTTAITTASSMPMHTSPSTMLTAMTTATTTAHPSNFTIISKSNAHTVTPTMEATINNTSHVNYSVFSLLRLLSYRSGNLFYFNITFSPTPTCASLLAALSTFSPQLCMDLIHCHLGHASKAHCQESIQQSTNFSNQENALHNIAASFPSSVHICYIQLDNAKELNAHISKWIAEVGGRRKPTPLYTSKYNGVTEQFNCKIMT
ncbi:uncharacterized protein ACA1_231430, partial [Acanthamoeba castellanii str. Neff]